MGEAALVTTVKRYPCGSCPYRRDVPSGVWAREEYEKLPRYDGPTWTQPQGAFFCHQGDDCLCSGWVGCHDMDESLALRLQVASGRMTPEEYEAALDYECPVPLFASGQEAHDHGVAEIETQGERAQLVVAKIRRKRGL